MRNRKQKIKYILLLCMFSMFLIASCKRSETGKTVESKEVINAQWENAAHTPYGKNPPDFLRSSRRSRRRRQHILRTSLGSISLLI